MREIAAVPPNGLRMASLFAGCGGSSLGYRMAGFKVAYANEFVEAARDTYRINAAYGTVLDGRDIRQVKPAEILEAMHTEAGELDVLDGSPPCAAFSTAGIRQQGWNKVKKYSETAQRTDDLFLEYIRILAGLRPKVFVAENVSGLVKGVSKGQFVEILQRMKALGYRVEARVLDAQWLGVPQLRARLFFVGVREDLDKTPAFPKPLPYRYSLGDACPWILAQGDNAGFGGGRMRSARNYPSGTIGASPATGNGNFPPSLVEALAGVSEAEIKAADITDYAIGKAWDDVAPGAASKRFFSLKKASVNEPCKTITAEGGYHPLATVTHPTEKRKFYIVELRRVCGFPDDFLLTGSYMQQYERLGRAVPPVMMSHLAGAIRDGVFGRTEAVQADLRARQKRRAAV